MEETDGMYCWECGLDISESKQVMALQAKADKLANALENATIRYDRIAMIKALKEYRGDKE